MLFSESMFEEEQIFRDYYVADNVYFRLKQAYLAYVSRSYVVDGRELEHCVFEIIANECEKKEDLPDICRIALLKYFSDRDYPADMVPVLHQVLREMCEKQIVFPFYLKYKAAWLKESQIYDQVMISHKAPPGSKVTLFYKIKSAGREVLGYKTEAMIPTYENIYVKQFVLFADEEMQYYFQETIGKEVITTEKMTLRSHHKGKEGKYGRMNAMMRMSPARRKKAMIEYDEEEMMAEQMFKVY